MSNIDLVHDPLLIDELLLINDPLLRNEVMLINDSIEMKKGRGRPRKYPIIVKPPKQYRVKAPVIRQPREIPYPQSYLKPEYKAMLETKHECPFCSLMVPKWHTSTHRKTKRCIKTFNLRNNNNNIVEYLNNIV